MFDVHSGYSDRTDRRAEMAAFDPADPPSVPFRGARLLLAICAAPWVVAVVLWVVLL